MTVKEQPDPGGGDLLHAAPRLDASENRTCRIAGKDREGKQHDACGLNST